MFFLFQQVVDLQGGARFVLTFDQGNKPGGHIHLDDILSEKSERDIVRTMPIGKFTFVLPNSYNPVTKHLAKSLYSGSRFSHLLPTKVFPCNSSKKS